MKNIKVLIVDDAIFIRMALKTILNKHGFEIVGEAANGAEAVAKYQELHPDLVTMDITMPEMDGVAALKAIREYDSKAKVVMVSALGQESIIKEAVVYGAKGFIVKPFKEELVVQTLKKVAAM
jgi:two-component system chemotaxis response regulator CheY